jgi:hypothetical protein
VGWGAGGRHEAGPRATHAAQQRRGRQRAQRLQRGRGVGAPVPPVVRPHRHRQALQAREARQRAQPRQQLVGAGGARPLARRVRVAGAHLQRGQALRARVRACGRL